MRARATPHAGCRCMPNRLNGYTGNTRGTVERTTVQPPGVRITTHWINRIPFQLRKAHSSWGSGPASPISARLCITLICKSAYSRADIISIWTTAASPLIPCYPLLTFDERLRWWEWTSRHPQTTPWILDNHLWTSASRLCMVFSSLDLLYRILCGHCALDMYLRSDWKSGERYYSADNWILYKRRGFTPRGPFSFITDNRTIDTILRVHFPSRRSWAFRDKPVTPLRASVPLLVTLE